MEGEIGDMMLVVVLEFGIEKSIQPAAKTTDSNIASTEESIHSNIWHEKGHLLFKPYKSRHGITMTKVAYLPFL